MLVEYGIAKDQRSTGYHAGVLEAVLSFANMASMGVRNRHTSSSARSSMLRRSGIAAMGTRCRYERAKICDALRYFGYSHRGHAIRLSSFLRIAGGLQNPCGCFQWVCTLFATGHSPWLTWPCRQAAIAKTYFSELSDETNEATAFSVMSLAWQIGWCLAAMAGGYLNHAERLFPSLSGSDFIRTYPYALPFLAVAVPPILSVTLGYFVLPETLERRPMTDGELQESSGKGAGLTADWTPHMWQAVKMWSMLVCTNVSFQATLPLFLFTPVGAGGLGIGSEAIGTRSS